MESTIDVSEHEGLLWKCIKRWRWATYGGTMQVDDLLQAGRIGLMRAAAKHDPAKGKFSTYATLWVNHYMRREATERSRTVRVPQEDQLAAWRTGDRVPLICVSLELEPDDDREGWLRSESRRDPLDEGQVENQGDVSAMEEEKATWVASAITELPERLANVLRMRFYRDMTLVECGNEMGVSRERVRQLEVVAMKAVKAVLERKKPDVDAA